jgi:hypothetical protein
MIRSIRLLAALFVLSLAGSACARPQATVETYERDGVSFSHFSNWRIDQDRPIAGSPGARIIHIEGPDHALISLIRLPGASDATAESFAAFTAKGRTKTVEKNVGGFTALQESGGASEPATAKIAGREVRGVRQTFDMVLLGQHIPHEATFYMVKTGTHKMVIMSQVAREHLEATRPAWQKVYDTLSLGDPAETTVLIVGGS